MTFCGNGDIVLKHVDFSKISDGKIGETGIVLTFSFHSDVEMFCFSKAEEVLF